ncbi:Hypothetical protein NGAL_HAMBI2605_65950 [Neorhizobium galegae bv. orientalis]|nr:Hypothetical protein NGAL_HAMBI2605_65950 [Neorhizobium galegae bv. orientalis]
MILAIQRSFPLSTAGNSHLGREIKRRIFAHLTGSFRHVAYDFEVVTIRVNHEGGIIMLVILRT